MQMSTITLNAVEVSVLYSAVAHHYNILNCVDLDYLDKTTQKYLKKEIETAERLRDRLLSKITEVETKTGGIK